MKAILLSIHPRHCGNIASGKKTVEVRKTAPKIPTPFKCYIYETKGRYIVYQKGAHTKYGYGRGKVIGEFVCDRIDTIRDEGNGFVAGGVQQSEWHSAAQTLIQAACLTEKELKAYIGDGYGYGWHISDLKIYDKPRELREFKKPLESVYCSEHKEKGCDRKCVCFSRTEYCNDYWDWEEGIARPPQSYMFVEKLE